MRLTLHTDYALRVLMFAALRREELTTITEIADQFDISRGHLMKVVNRLGRLGYLDTVRGKKGGFRLLRKPDQVVLGAVVRDFEEELAIVGCLQRDNYCPIAAACVLKRALQEATAAFLGVLDRYTLADLVRPGKSLAKLLDLSGTALPPAARA